jgi:hypothetical protein
MFGQLKGDDKNFLSKELKRLNKDFVENHPEKEFTVISLI